MLQYLQCCCKKDIGLHWRTYPPRYKLPQKKIIISTFGIVARPHNCGYPRRGSKIFYFFLNEVPESTLTCLTHESCNLS